MWQVQVGGGGKKRGEVRETMGAVNHTLLFSHCL